MRALLLAYYANFSSTIYQSLGVKRIPVLIDICCNYD